MIYKVRHMISNDLESVALIGYDATDCLRRHLKKRNGIGVVAELNDHVIGYMLYEHNPDSMGIIQLVTYSEFMRCGIASSIIHQLIEKSRRIRKKKIVAVVNERNLAALLFFKKHGFRAVHILPDHYETGDAYVMELNLC